MAASTSTPSYRQGKLHLKHTLWVGDLGDTVTDSLLESAFKQVRACVSACRCVCVCAASRHRHTLLVQSPVRLPPSVAVRV